MWRNEKFCVLEKKSAIETFQLNNWFSKKVCKNFKNLTKQLWPNICTDPSLKNIFFLINERHGFCR